MGLHTNKYKKEKNQEPKTSKNLVFKKKTLFIYVENVGLYGQ